MAFSILTLHDCRLEGFWNRLILNGMKISEFFISNIIQYFMNSTIITIEMMLLLKILLQIEILGSCRLAFLIIFLTAFDGFLCGLITSIIFDNLFIIAGFGFHFSFLSMSLSGIVWPIEGASKYIQPLVYLYPLTMPADALRDIYFKGSNLLNFDIQLALFYLIFCTLFHCFLCLIVLKYKIFK
ncbi:hypothetical protein PVAND_008555 [Polypedilum vanderplanki]|uniref:ABC-2 type transporter transmembrane domain-containing protein n=1 Tax=Polypedilum vanderplanki TaxID=319348 RepID=A0A9J6CAL9_POLVA|nr:hypothetical protein PVAND_008555 [Polypedilum vanderplanki]